jgi:hypothetical protein
MEINEIIQRIKTGSSLSFGCKILDEKDQIFRDSS